MLKQTVLPKLLNTAIVLLILAALAISAALIFAYDAFFAFLASRFAGDNAISNPHAVVISIYLLLGALIFIDVLLKGAWIYYEDEIPVAALPQRLKIFYVSIVGVIIFSMVFHKVPAIYGEDGLLENATALFAFASGIIFLSLLRYFKKPIQKLYLYGFGAAAILFACEEISWGQRIFGWETPAYLMENNVQQESNLHNLFNDYFDFGYLMLTGALATVFFYRKQLIGLLGRIPQLKNLIFFVPAKQFFYTGYVFIYLMLFTLIIEKGAETLEVSISVFLLFYSYNLMLRTKKAAQAGLGTTAPQMVQESSR
ncbi:MAG: hypothetical protein H6574_21995 [Lewinellaceae bacterium]|nr:hypothetical protein [Saprospiraceae bacterium]MCB9333737.1 hypothetical protein [Lewinellaceae bacterium]